MGGFGTGSVHRFVIGGRGANRMLDVLASKVASRDERVARMARDAFDDVVDHAVVTRGGAVGPSADATQVRLSVTDETLATIFDAESSGMAFDYCTMIAEGRHADIEARLADFLDAAARDSAHGAAGGVADASMDDDGEDVVGVVTDKVGDAAAAAGRAAREAASAVRESEAFEHGREVATEAARKGRDTAAKAARSGLSYLTSKLSWLVDNEDNDG